MSVSTKPGALPDKPRRLLTNSNRNLARDRIWTWTLPALAARLPDGRTILTCPSAGVCAQVCYARAGTYTFPAVKAAHLRNLRYVIDDLCGWEAAMTKELTARRFHGAYVRIHDSGDFFSDAYTEAWLRVIASAPHTTFYAYTKEISRYERLIAPRAPANSRWILSYGGTEDARIDPLRDRVADVFPDEESLTAAGFHSQARSDLLAAFGPTPVGMSANNLPTLKRRQGARTFREWQQQVDQARPDAHGARRRGRTGKKKMTTTGGTSPQARTDLDGSAWASRRSSPTKTRDPGAS